MSVAPAQANVLPRVLPYPWVLTAGELAKICKQDVPPPPASRVLIPDVERFCRGAIADAQKRGRLHREIERGDYLEVLGFLLGEVVVHSRKYDPARRGIEFRPWLYERIRAFSVVDACRWLYGRQGQHRVPDETQLIDAARRDVEFDDGADLGDRLVEPAGGDETDRLDARGWLDAEADRPQDADVRVTRGGADRHVAGSDRGAGVGARGRVTVGVGRQAHWFDCVACGWRNFPQAPNGVARWHYQRCGGCGAELTEEAA